MNFKATINYSNTHFRKSSTKPATNILFLSEFIRKSFRHNEFTQNKSTENNLKTYERIKEHQEEEEGPKKY